MLPLLCPVRHCRQLLVEDARTFRCPHGHSFDLAKSGYLNLLQPQDRRSLAAGDAKEVAQARRRLFAAGLSDFLLAGVRRWLPAARPERWRERLCAGNAGRLLQAVDIGAGEGSMLGTLAAEAGFAACGVDLSAPAIELAARRWLALDWVVVNADRFLPFPDASLDLVTSFTARLPAAELARVVAPGGHLWVAVAAADDLVELRAAVQGEGELRSRWQRAVEELGGAFELLEQTELRERLALAPDELRDLLATTYRGARRSQREAVAALGAMAVTLSRDLLWLQRRSGP